MINIIIGSVVAALDITCSFITEAHSSHIYGMHILISFFACLGMFITTCK